MSEKSEKEKSSDASEHEEAIESSDERDLGRWTQAAIESTVGGIGAYVAMRAGAPDAGVAVGLGSPIVLRGLKDGGIKTRNAIIEYVQRHLTDLQRERVNLGLTMFGQRIEAHISAGHEPRVDGTESQVLEGALNATSTTHDRRKIGPLAQLPANYAFETSVTLNDAELVLSLSSQMTYEQHVLLDVIARIQRGELKVREGHYTESITEPRLHAVLQQVLDLYNRGWVWVRNSPVKPLVAGEDGFPEESGHAILCIENFSPAGLTLSVGGERAHSLLGLADTTCSEEIELLREVLQ